MSNQTSVEPGQVWADNDKRAAGRRVRVLSVADGYAEVEVIADRTGRHVHGKHYRAPGGAAVRLRTRIRLDRFRPTSTGYRLTLPAARAATDFVVRLIEQEWPACARCCAITRATRLVDIQWGEHTGGNLLSRLADMGLHIAGVSVRDLQTVGEVADLVASQLDMQVSVMNAGNSARL